MAEVDKTVAEIELTQRRRSRSSDRAKQTELEANKRKDKYSQSLAVMDIYVDVNI